MGRPWDRCAYGVIASARLVARRNSHKLELDYHAAPDTSNLYFTTKKRPAVPATHDATSLGEELSRSAEDLRPCMRRRRTRLLFRDRHKG